MYFIHAENFSLSTIYIYIYIYCIKLMSSDDVFGTPHSLGVGNSYEELTFAPGVMQSSSNELSTIIPSLTQRMTIALR